MINPKGVKRRLMLIGWSICVYASLVAQCPTNDSILSRINIIYYSDSLAASEKIEQGLLLLEGIKKCPVADSTFAILLTTLGSFQIENGDYLEGIRYVNNAIAFIRNKQGSATLNPGYLVTCYYTLFQAYNSLQSKSERMRALDSCVKVGTRYNVFNLRLIYAIILRAQYFFNIGDYRNCYTYADMAEKMAKQYAMTEQRGKSSYGKDYAMTSIGYKVNALLALKDYEACIPLVKYAEVEEFKRSKDYRFMGMAYGQLSEIEMEKGNFESARSLLETAFDYELKYGKTDKCITILNNQGVLLSEKFRDPGLAIPYYLRAYQYKKAGMQTERADSIERVNVLSNLGIAYTKKKKYDSGFYFFRLAYDYVGKGWNENVFLTSSTEVFAGFPKMDYLIKLLVAKAGAYVGQYKATLNPEALNEAIRMYTVTEKILFRIKAEQLNIGSKLTWRKNFHLLLYDNAIEACHLQGNLEAALYFFERSKAILLNDQLNEQRLTADFDILKQSQLKKQIIQIERKIENTDKQSSAFNVLNSDLFRKQQELEQLQLHIRTNNPFYYQYSLDSSSIKIKDVRQSLLKDHQALLEIFSGDSSVYILMISQQKNTLIKLYKPLYDSLSIAFLTCLSNQEIANSNYRMCNSTSTRLYDLIFKNLGMPAGRIIISPDGKYFPFEALVTSVTSGANHYFIEDHAVSYTYSARYLMNASLVNTHSSSENFMGMAPVNFSTSMHLPGLDGSEQSLERVASHFSKSDNWISGKATRNNFLNNFYRYKIIQLYTHATDSGFNKEPVIYFSDSALLLSDLLYENKPSTSLIVLSACETGTGKLYEGEGVFGFNRGFAALGIPTSISNLWQVENTSTYKLTELFYQYLSKGLPIDVALQKAKIDFIKSASGERKLPYYWAAPILTGKTDTLEMQKSYAWMYIIGAICFGALVFGLLRTRIKKQELQEIRKANYPTESSTFSN